MPLGGGGQQGKKKLKMDGKRDFIAYMATRLRCMGGMRPSAKIKRISQVQIRGLLPSLPPGGPEGSASHRVGDCLGLPRMGEEKGRRSPPDG